MRRALDRLASAAVGRAPLPGAWFILMYHAVTPRTFDDPDQMAISAGRFAEHLDVLASLAVDLLPFDAAVARLSQGGPKRAAATVVFDDGFVGVHDCAAELLAARRVPATVFIRTAHMDADRFPEADPRLGRPLTWNEVRALHKGGLSIGSHSHTHPVMTAIDDAALVREIRMSRDRITIELGAVPRSFAYPFGSYGTFNAATRQALINEGFHMACTTVWGSNRAGADLLALKRIRASWADRPADLRRSLAGCRDWYVHVQRLQRAARRSAV